MRIDQAVCCVMASTFERLLDLLIFCCFVRRVVAEHLTRWLRSNTPFTLPFRAAASSLNTFR